MPPTTITLEPPAFALGLAEDLIEHFALAARRNRDERAVRTGRHRAAEATTTR